MTSFTNDPLFGFHDFITLMDFEKDHTTKHWWHCHCNLFKYSEDLIKTNFESIWRKLELVFPLKNAESAHLGQFHQPIGAQHKCAGAQSLAQAVSPTKHHKTLPKQNN